MIEFLREMTVGNQHLFWHLFGGMLLGVIFYKIAYSNKKRFALLCTFAVVILFEVFELYIGNGIGGYSGGLMGYIADTVGDVGGAVLFVWVINK